MSSLERLLTELSTTTPAPRTPVHQPGRFDTAHSAILFIQGGRATFTLRSQRTGAHFTYRARESDDETLFFIDVLTGENNETDFTYLGQLRNGTWEHGRKSRIASTAPSARAFAWAWNALCANTIPPELEIWHEGRCGRCNRKLTVPESIEIGFGPECMGAKGLIRRNAPAPGLSATEQLDELA